MAVYGYIRASTLKEVATPEEQEDAILATTEKFALPDPLLCIDPHTEGHRPLFERIGGHQLAMQLERGDMVICTKLGLLCRTVEQLAVILDTFHRQGVRVYICGTDWGWLDPSLPLFKLINGIIISLIDFEKEANLLAFKEKKARKTIAAMDWKPGDTPPYGWQVEDRQNCATGEAEKILVSNPKEQEIMRRVVELRAKGWSNRRIAEKFNTDWTDYKPRPNLNGTGAKWSLSMISNTYQRGLHMMSLAEPRAGRLGRVPSLEDEMKAEAARILEEELELLGT